MGRLAQQVREPKMIHIWPAPLMLAGALWLAVPADRAAEQEAWRLCQEVEQTLRAAPSDFRPPEDTIQSIVERCRARELSQ